MGQKRNMLEYVYRVFDSIKPDKFGCHNYPREDGIVGFYACISINRKCYKAHRLALERKLGRPIKTGHMALHHCDNKSCVNEDHLYEGTAKDNTQDFILRNSEAYYLHFQQKGINAPRKKWGNQWRKNNY